MKQMAYSGEIVEREGFGLEGSGNPHIERIDLKNRIAESLESGNTHFSLYASQNNEDMRPELGEGIIHHAGKQYTVLTRNRACKVIDEKYHGKQFLKNREKGTEKFKEIFALQIKEHESEYPLLIKSNNIYRDTTRNEYKNSDLEKELSVLIKRWMEANDLKFPGYFRGNNYERGQAMYFRLPFLIDYKTVLCSLEKIKTEGKDGEILYDFGIFTEDDRDDKNDAFLLLV